MTMLTAIAEQEAENARLNAEDAAAEEAAFAAEAEELRRLAEEEKKP